MYPRILFALLAAIPAVAQFSELATTADGNQLYFSSQLRLKGAAGGVPAPEWRIYRWTPDGVELFAERGNLVPRGPTISGSNSEGASLPQVSSDGRLVGFTLRNACMTPGPPEEACTAIPGRGELRGTAARTLGEGSLELSRNGRWALLIPPFGPGPAQAATLIDLETDSRASVPAPPLQAAAIASDGSVLTGSGIWRDGAVKPISLTGGVLPLALSDSGQVLVYMQFSMAADAKPNGARLLVRNLSTSADTVLFAPVASRFQGPQFMSVSNDGRWVLYRVTEARIEGPAFLADSTTGVSRPISLREGELASAGVLNDAGDVAFVATTAGRIVRIRVGAGGEQSLKTVVPATPFINVPFGFVPGSMVRLARTGPSGADGRYLLDDKPLPVLFKTDQEVAVQVPWEQRTGELPFRLDFAGDSPFAQIQTAVVLAFAPRFEPADPGTTSLLGIKMVTADFSALVTTPPAPSDIVHMYMTGLGAVQGSVTTGVPAPLDSLRPITGSVTCRFAPQTAPATTLFAGLAPGMTGVYQVTLRLPDQPFASPLAGLDCGSFAVYRLVMAP